jgi:hypothetical protein
VDKSIDVVARVRAAEEHSELIRAVALVRRDGGVSLALDDGPLRALSADELATLERWGCSAQDWSRIRVIEGFDPRSVRHTHFCGDVVLGRFARTVSVAQGLELPSGICHCTLANCVIGNDVLIRDVKLLANYVVCAGAVLLDAGSILCDGETAFGNGIELPIAIETGGREVRVYAEIDVEVAAAVARGRSDRARLEQYAAAVAEYTREATSSRAIICRSATVRSTPLVHNVYLGPHADLTGATSVAHSTILSNRDEPVHIRSGACVSHSLVQWGCHVTTMAIVDNSVLTEHSHVERHGKVTGSIVGPNSGVAEGEVTASLLGPFVGFHHQALLIAAFWPEGKGNVGYGANVGSNHTSKAPDQEIWPGEGAFFGLGVNVKFPANFTQAPYSIFASGVSALPQRITFPFSLINSPAVHYPGISPAYNEIIPAWLLTDNLYTLKRNEGKYKKRNQAKRTQFEFDVFRPDIVDLMRDACRRLEAVRQVKEVYTDADIKGLGKNFLLEANRHRAIRAYRDFIRYYALAGLKRQLDAIAENDGAAVRSVLESAGTAQPWEHQRQVLAELGVTDLVAALRELHTMSERLARAVEESKAKDDKRGREIIDDYADVHAAAAADSFVKQTWTDTRRTQAEIESLIERLA